MDDLIFKKWSIYTTKYYTAINKKRNFKIPHQGDIEEAAFTKSFKQLKEVVQVPTTGI